MERMVARDGIEPPTGAFSGPRSTTELSGLGAAMHKLALRAAKFACRAPASQLRLPGWEGITVPPVGEAFENVVTQV